MEDNVSMFRKLMNIRQKIDESINSLNPKQEEFIFFGVVIPLLPAPMLELFNIFFGGCTLLGMAGDLLLGCYSITCSVLCLFHGVNAVRLRKKFFYALEIVFIAFINVIFNKYEDITSVGGKVLLVCLFVIIVVFTVANLKQTIIYLGNKTNIGEESDAYR